MPKSYWLISDKKSGYLCFFISNEFINFFESIWFVSISFEDFEFFFRNFEKLRILDIFLQLDSMSHLRIFQVMD